VEIQIDGSLVVRESAVKGLDTLVVHERGRQLLAGDRIRLDENDPSEPGIEVGLNFLTAMRADVNHRGLRRHLQAAEQEADVSIVIVCGDSHTSSSLLIRRSVHA
jgi:hypothetical protein